MLIPKKNGKKNLYFKALKSLVLLLNLLEILHTFDDNLLRLFSEILLYFGFILKFEHL